MCIEPRSARVLSPFGAKCVLTLFDTAPNRAGRPRPYAQDIAGGDAKRF